jgi:ATP-dependent protease ClpP protease subunit
MHAFADVDFTPNVNRSIWIKGEMNKSLLESLRPQILDLTSRSRRPVTVFIDSPGGNAAVGERIMSLLRSAGQEGPPACRIITIAMSKALSTAADFLSSGDLAIATPGSTLLYHGSRLPTLDLADAKRVGLMAHGLNSSDEKYAISLTRRSVASGSLLRVRSTDS